VSRSTPLRNHIKVIAEWYLVPVHTSSVWLWALQKGNSKYKYGGFGSVIIHEQRVTLLCNSPYSEIKISTKRFTCIGIITNCHRQIFPFDIVIPFGLYSVGKIYLNCMPVHEPYPTLLCHVSDIWNTVLVLARKFRYLIVDSVMMTMMMPRRDIQLR
jgi:hypothetical protein